MLWASLPRAPPCLRPPPILPFPLARVSALCPTQVLVLSSASRKASAVGDVVNLVSVDVQRLTESIIYLNGLWLPAIWIAICFVYLWQVCRRSQALGRCIRGISTAGEREHSPVPSSGCHLGFCTSTPTAPPLPYGARGQGPF